jgi:acyl carrier protein phosphodiesterase
MNYLGHAYLSFGNADTLCGNMIGDFVKGTIALQHYPIPIRKGIELHRKIDTYTDIHPSIAQAKEIFRPHYHLYAGAIVDTVLDHFIANDEHLFTDAAALDNFASRTYAQLTSHREFFPERFVPYYESMLQHNWLVHYRTEAGLKQSLGGLMRRSKHIEEIETAFDLLIEHRQRLSTYYTSFISDVIDFVKIELPAR